MKITHLVAALGLTISFSSQGQPSPSTEHLSQRTEAGSPAAGTMAEGEVRKVDKEQGKITLRHGPIANLDMPGMTMVFKAADPRMLDTVKQGDKIRFSAANVNGVVTVTAIEPAK